MPTTLIYIIRCKGYQHLTPYIWEVEEKAPYHRCGFVVTIVEESMKFTILSKSSMNFMFDISSAMSTKVKKEAADSAASFMLFYENDSIPHIFHHMINLQVDSHMRVK